MDTPCLSPRPQAPLCRRPADPHLLRLEASGGEASETHYPVFPGMELIYRDIHAHTCRENRGGTGERLEIHHCLEGRIEYRQSGRYFYLAPGDLVVARSSSLPQGSRFPTGHYHGIAVVIDPAAAPECLSCILSDVEVRPAALMEKLCPGGAVFAARSSRRVRRTGGHPQGLPKGKAVRAAAVSQHPLPRRSPGPPRLHRRAGHAGRAGTDLPAFGAGPDHNASGPLPAVRRFRRPDQKQLYRGLRNVPRRLRPGAADARRGGAAAADEPHSAGYCGSVWV